ncbi:MAG: DUF503 domain-containing protein [Acidobacteriota bacterium]
MIVGAVRVEIRIHGSTSLKEKRSVLRRIMDRARSRHNLSVAEVDFQEKHQRACLGFAAVSQSEDHLRRLFQGLRDEIEQILPAGILDWQEDFLV